MKQLLLICGIYWIGVSIGNWVLEDTSTNFKIFIFVVGIVAMLHYFIV